MLRSVYPVLMTDKIEESSLFYKSYLGFSESYSSSWYISLTHADGFELALIDASHETIPKASRMTVQGMILNIEVENATQMYMEFMENASHFIIMPLCDEDYGQRHFMIQDPNQIMIDIIEEIPPSKEYEEHYKNGV